MSIKDEHKSKLELLIEVRQVLDELYCLEDRVGDDSEVSESWLYAMYLDFCAGQLLLANMRAKFHSLRCDLPHSQGRKVKHVKAKQRSLLSEEEDYDHAQR